MLDLFLIILLIISISKPDVLLAKKVKESTTEEQKNTLAKNFRKIYGLLIATIECTALQRYIDSDFSFIFLLVSLVLLVLFFVFAIPAIKENREIVKNIK